MICPKDFTRLEVDSGDGSYRCPDCRVRYAVAGGVARFMDREDIFYESAYSGRVKFIPKSENWYHVFPLWVINSGYLWNVRKQVEPSGVVLEMGCACGVDYFSMRYKMIGQDLSIKALRETANRYLFCLQADVQEKIPLEDESVDAVISSYFLEYIPPGKKGEVLSECMRVLKPGGKGIFLYDVATRNRLIESMKKSSPERYQRLFLDGDGHLGYQTIEENRRIFEGNGFMVLKHFGMERTWLQSHSVYVKLREESGIMGLIGRIGSLLDQKPWNYLHMLLVLAVDHTIGRLFPKNCARIVMTVLQKPA